MRALALFLFVALPASAGTVLQAAAGVNLVDMPPRAVSYDGTPVSQSASGDGSSATAHASARSIGASAQSQDAVLYEGASATAAAQTTFRVTSRSGRTDPVPLTFNLGVSGAIHASSSPDPRAGPDVSVANVSIRSNVDLSERNGSILLGSQKGVLVLQLTSGAFGAGGAGHGPTEWSVEVRLATAALPAPWELLPRYGTFVGLAFDFYGALSAAQKVVQTIEGQAQTTGFPELGFPPKIALPVAQLTFGINNTFPVTTTIRPGPSQSHFMGLSIILEASSSPTAESSVDYNNTVALESVTVDDMYEGDPADLVVTFEDGTVYPVTRAGPRRRAVRH